MDATWMGDPLDTMSRERLIKIIMELDMELSKFRTPEMIHTIALGKSYHRIRDRSRQLGSEEN